ncbi:MAG: SMC-Scp complex subunit ScpB [Clostridia bacterium]|nr:SMC-Scp complex subunit ScpB [Clostridia bacterium]
MDNTNQLPLNDGPNYSMEERFAIIEACLFAAGHPLTYERLADVLNLTVAECEDTVEKMVAVYNNDSPIPRGVMLVRFPESCQLCTQESYGDQIKIALGMKRGGNLSQSLLEVLAVIAYNQPTTRAFVDAVRGVDSSYAVGSLVEKDLIEQCGRLDAPGRPSLYRTTTKFLRVFGISELSELPTITLKNDNGEPVEITPTADPLTEQVEMDIE